jgi:hypothetical protein
MSELLKVVGLTAGIGGLALGVFLILFKRISLPKGTSRHLTLFMWLVWSVCIVGMIIFFIVQFLDKRNERERLGTASTSQAPSFKIELICGEPPPADESELARLFEFAESKEGRFAQVNMNYYWGNCGCPSKQEHPLSSLELVCQHNPNWMFAERMKKYICVQAVGIAGYLTGVGSFCFPPYDLLPIKAGYSRGQTATHQSISGEFLVSWEWSLGGPHVQLLLPD